MYLHRFQRGVCFYANSGRHALASPPVNFSHRVALSFVQPTCRLRDKGRLTKRSFCSNAAPRPEFFEPSPDNEVFSHPRVIRHTLVLTHPGTCTPVYPIGDEDFWEEAVPDADLWEDLNPTEGEFDAYLEDASSIWGELTIQGVNEAKALGLKIKKWLEEAAVKPEDVPRTTTVISAKERHAVHSAWAIVSGLGLPGPIEFTALQELEPRGLFDEGLPSKEDAASVFEFASVLINEPKQSWQGLLQSAESAENFGLLASNKLNSRARTALIYHERRLQRILHDLDKESMEREVSDAESSTVLAGLRPLVEASFGMCFTAALDPSVDERLRICVMSRQALLCCAAVLGVEDVFGWSSSPSSCLRIETIIAETPDSNGREIASISCYRGAISLRPSWHTDTGNALLHHLGKRLLRLGLLSPEHPLRNPGIMQQLEIGIEIESDDTVEVAEEGPLQESGASSHIKGEFRHVEKAMLEIENIEFLLKDGVDLRPAQAAKYARKGIYKRRYNELAMQVGQPRWGERYVQD